MNNLNLKKRAVFKHKPSVVTKVQEDKKRVSQTQKLAYYLEKMRLGDYIQTLNNPWRIIWTNLLAGISRGVGLTVGATVVIAILFKILAVVIAMKIPYLTDVLQDFMQTITPHNPSYMTQPMIEGTKQVHIERDEVSFEERKPNETRQNLPITK